MTCTHGPLRGSAEEGAKPPNTVPPVPPLPGPWSLVLIARWIVHSQHPGASDADVLYIPKVGEGSQPSLKKREMFMTFFFYGILMQNL